MDNTGRVIPIRERARIIDDWLEKRLDTLLPPLMAETGIDMWIVASMEENEDSVLKTMLPFKEMKRASRRTILLFFLRGDGTVERLLVSRPNLEYSRFYKAMLLKDKDSEPTLFTTMTPEKFANPEGSTAIAETQMECLKRVIDERNPTKIGLDFSPTDNYGDGITHGLYTLIAESIGAVNAAKIVSAEKLAIRWLETRLPEEMVAYKGLVTLTAELIKEGLSEKAIHPGVTTCDDLTWWMMQRCEDLHLRLVFPFSISVKRQGVTGLSDDAVILEGDIVHCDGGAEYLGLVSDMQHNSYVLRRGEAEPPAGIAALFRQGCRVQELIAEELRVGRQGNEILVAVLARCRAEGHSALVYSHPVGNYVHCAGPTIGLFSNQSVVKDRGDHVVHDNSIFAIEFCVIGEVPEWNGQKVMMLFETDALVSRGKVEFYYRQPCLHTVK